MLYIYILIITVSLLLIFFLNKNLIEKYRDLWDSKKVEDDMIRFTSGLFGGVVSAIEGISKAIQPKIPGKRGCPDGMRDDGTSCWLDTYANGVGTIPTLNPCPDGSNDVAGTCWYPGSGGDCSGGGCRTVDNGYHNYSWGRWGCNGPRNRETKFLGQTTGWDDCYQTWIAKLETKCDPIRCNPIVAARVAKNIGDRGGSCGNKANVAGLCYNHCKSGYSFRGGNLCEPNGGPGIKVTAFQRYECPPPGASKHTKLVGALCYVP